MPVCEGRGEAASTDRRQRLSPTNLSSPPVMASSSSSDAPLLDEDGQISDKVLNYLSISSLLVTPSPLS